MATQNVLPEYIRTLLGVSARPEVGTEGPDVKPYLTGDHYYQGLGGNDTITGGLGDEYFEGGAGADTFLADLGGNDTLGWFNSDTSVSVTLSALGGIQSASGGHANDDRAVSGFENLVGTLFDDDLRGNAGANILVGLDGNDALYGEDGNDTLVGGAGTDFHFGGGGTDSVNYRNAPDAVTLTLASGGTAGEATGDHYSSIENVTGSDYADEITGNNSINFIEGLAGNDKLYGGEGNDILHGDAGDDELYAGVGHDSLYGGSGDDYFEPYVGNDSVYMGSGGSDKVVYNDMSEAKGDRIYDFKSRDDEIDLQFGFTPHITIDYFGDITQVTFSHTGHNSVILLIQGIDVNRDDFV